MKLTFALFFAALVTAVAQSPQVPSKLRFADLTIRDDARAEIQKDVDAFTRYAPSFNAKVERARMYFPIIEKIFAEENVPDDLKYLVIQESALIADAVSSSNAVGFWQFKDFTAIEMGLRIDKEVDERLHIMASSRAAARYLKKNNTFFDNWLFALQAYQMGAGGVMRAEKDSKSGEKHIEITSKTYWYVKKYLAHKIAYQDAIQGEPKTQLIAYQTQQKKTLSDLAKEVAIDENELKSYNKWAKNGIVPGDKNYTVLIPVAGKVPPQLVSDVPAVATETPDVKLQKTIPKPERDALKINGIPTIKAKEGESAAALAQRAGVPLTSFLRWNDLQPSDAIKSGFVYLLGTKRARASEAYHKVLPGDDLWSISQRYGVKIKKLKRYNRMDNSQTLTPGTTLWLASVKPKPAEKMLVKTPVEVNEAETFAWGAEAETAKQETTVTRKETAGDRFAREVNDTVQQQVPQSEIRKDADPLPAKDTVYAVALPVASDTVTTVVPARSTSTEIKTKEHTVQAGETLYGIARKYNVGVMDLVNWNKLDLQQGIKPGQVIRLSDAEAIDTPVATSKTSSAAEPIEHIVMPSDTVYSIARKYGVTIKELMEWNNKKDFTLAVGEKLKVIKK
jgi:membrane-bound lytic murein transglycosylase D